MDDHKTLWRRDEDHQFFITDPHLIGQILEHLAAGSESLWLREASGYRSLPETHPANRPPMEMARRAGSLTNIIGKKVNQGIWL